RHQRRLGLVDRQPLLRRGAVVAGVLVVAVAAGVLGRPDIVARYRGVGEQRVAGGRGVGAVAVDRDRLGVDDRGAGVGQREGDRPGRGGAAGRARRVLQGLRRRAERDRPVGAGGRHQRRGIHGDGHPLLRRGAVVAGVLVVAVAGVLGRPDIVARYCP